VRLAVPPSDGEPLSCSCSHVQSLWKTGKQSIEHHYDGARMDYLPDVPGRQTSDWRSMRLGSPRGWL